MVQEIIARRMLKKGLEVMQIVEFTGLTAQEIRKAELLSQEMIHILGQKQ